MYKCIFCNKEFDSKQELGGHVTHCIKNPNYEENMNILVKAREYKNILVGIKTKECAYCGKKIGNSGCLVLHERRCKNNPDYIPTEKQLEKIERKNRPKHLSEEHKKHIREALAEWRKNNEELFLNYSRGKSKCCENFKNMLIKNGICFVEEYAPFLPDRLYSLDIAWPDEKIGVEINGSQHYNSKGEINDKTLEKQEYFEKRGWKIIQVYYKDCYNIDIKKISDILELPIKDKKYIKEDIISIHANKERKERQKEEKLLERLNIKNNIYEQNKKIVDDLIYNSNIDFTKRGWSKNALEYVKTKNPKWNSEIFRIIRKYRPDFLKQDIVWKRKGSIY